MSVLTPTVNLTTPAKVLHLQAMRGYPSVSILMTTRPSASMDQADAARLARLVGQALARLRAEATDEARRLGDALERLADLAVMLPTRQSVALFVSARAEEVLHLPVTVRDRVVVDPTFATRDLVRALHRTPRHVVLGLGAREARLFEGVAESLRPVSGSTFPLVDDGSSRGSGQADRRGRDRRGPRRGFLRRIDGALDAYLRVRPAPLVLLGDERTTAAFRSVSRNVDRLAGTVGGGLTAPLPTLVRRIREVLETHLRSREGEALALVERRVGAGRVVSGIHSAWLAARAERPEMLAVEEGFFYPARLSADGDYVMPADDVDHPDVVDDLVDELIETALQRGAWIALVGDGVLAEHDRVALTLRG